MFGFRDVEILQAIVRAGGFRAASTLTGMSQSAMSNRVAALERRLGVRLFDRLGRGVRLSTAGRRLLEESARLIAARDRVVRELAGGAGLRGSVRIGVAETIVHTLLTPLLASLRGEHPSVRFELTVDTSAELARRLTDDAIDVAILLDDAVPKGTAREPLDPITVDWYAGAAFVPEKCEDGAPLSLDALARESIVTYSKGTTPYRQIERLFAALDTPPLLHGSASLSAIRHLIAEGFGIGILPRRMVAVNSPGGVPRGVLPDARGDKDDGSGDGDVRSSGAPGDAAVRRLDVCPAARPDALHFVVAWLRSDEDETGAIVARSALDADRQAGRGADQTDTR